MNKKIKKNLILSEIMAVIDNIISLIILVFYINGFLYKSGLLEILCFFGVIFGIIMIILPIVTYKKFKKDKNEYLYKKLMSTYFSMAIFSIVKNAIIYLSLSMGLLIVTLMSGDSGKRDFSIFIVDGLYLLFGFIYFSCYILTIVIGMKKTFSKKTFEELNKDEINNNELDSKTKE